MTHWANFTQIYIVLHYLFSLCCFYCNSRHVIALIYLNFQQTDACCFSVKCMHIALYAFFDSPPGISRDRAPVETDLGTFGTAPVFSPALLGCRELAWAPWSSEVWLVLSGLSSPSPLGVNWSRCSEKLPNYYRRFAWSEVVILFSILWIII